MKTDWTLNLSINPKRKDDTHFELLNFDKKLYLCPIKWTSGYIETANWSNSWKTNHKYYPLSLRPDRGIELLNYEE